MLNSNICSHLTVRKQIIYNEYFNFFLFYHFLFSILPCIPSFDYSHSYTLNLLFFCIISFHYTPIVSSNITIILIFYSLIYSFFSSLYLFSFYHSLYSLFFSIFYCRLFISFLFLLSIIICIITFIILLFCCSSILSFLHSSLLFIYFHSIILYILSFFQSFIVVCLFLFSSFYLYSIIICVLTFIVILLFCKSNFLFSFHVLLLICHFLILSFDVRLFFPYFFSYSHYFIDFHFFFS